MLIVAVILGITTTQAQDISLSGGYAHAIEHLGDDIKEGASIKFAVDFDVFKKHNFHLGPTINITGFTNLVTTSNGVVYEEVEGQTFIAGGLLAGYDFGRFDFKSGVSANIRNSEPSSDYGYSFTDRLVLNNALEYRLKEDGLLALRLGHDYFFNQYLFHYTHQTTLGLTLKF